MCMGHDTGSYMLMLVLNGDVDCQCVWGMILVVKC